MDDHWIRQVDRRLGLLETHVAVDAVQRDNVDNRLQAIEDMLKWLVRLVMGGLVMALIGYLVAGGFALTAS
ncbi:MULTISPECIES: pseudouridine synthase [Marivivens]|uniref:pseudouridine synthase n=1 Tax=Marivivens TaxID=1759396 RepID=UPI002AD3738B|nr:pseudouridine synthase [Marivivens aquimaris]